MHRWCGTTNHIRFLNIYIYIYIPIYLYQCWWYILVNPNIASISRNIKIRYISTYPTDSIHNPQHPPRCRRWASRAPDGWAFQGVAIGVPPFFWRLFVRENPWNIWMMTMMTGATPSLPSTIFVHVSSTRWVARRPHGIRNTPGITISFFADKCGCYMMLPSGWWGQATRPEK